MNVEKAIYAVIDTNVLVSALFSHSGLSNPALVVNAVLGGAITPLYNTEIIEEYRDVLARDKFRFPKVLIDNLIAVFVEYGVESRRVSDPTEYFADRDDVVFYEVAMSREHSYLVTGNLKHFPQKPFVVTPAQMVEILRAKGLMD